MEGIGAHIFSALLTIGLVILGVAMLLTWGVTWFFSSSDSIKSDKPIKPEIQLVIKDNRVDTVYVYKKP